MLLAPVELADGVAVIRVVVPSSELEHGVAEAWAILAGIALLLLLVGVTIADRLASSITGPAVALADASERVADGDLTVRVQPAGPPELERAARGFNDLARRVTDLVVAERESVADLAHRLRTPLAAMRLDAEAVGDDEERARLAGDVDVLAHAVDTVIREARRPARHAIAPVNDLADTTRRRVEFWSALAEDQSRPWHVQIPDTVLPVAVPRDELEAVVDALLDNVFTHTPAGTGFTVAVVPTESGRVHLVVRDEGPGFHGGQAVSDGHVTGRTGLGLDIVRRAASAAGGSVDLAHDGGAVVRIELPLVTADATAPPATGRRRHRVTPS